MNTDMNDCMTRFPEVIQRVDGLRSVSETQQLLEQEACAACLCNRGPIPRGSVWKSMFTVPAMA